MAHLKYEERENHDKSFTATVTFMQQGSLKKFQSHGVHKSKSSADESAAESAIKCSKYTASCIITDHNRLTYYPFIVSPSSKQSKVMVQSKKTASTSVTPRPSPAAATKSGNPGPSMSPPNRIYVSKLKEYCEQQKWPKPTYTLIPQPEEQKFQYQAMVKTLTKAFTAMGSVCGSKTDAKHSAAQAALKKLPK